MVIIHSSQDPILTVTVLLGANAFDNTPWIINLTEFTRKILEEQSHVRVIGVCFGHQIIGRALGANVVRNTNGWEASVTPVHLSSRGQELFDGKYVLVFLAWNLPRRPLRIDC